MTEQRSTDEEPIIELTEVVEHSAAVDDDIIELTEVVESAPMTDEDIIELTDIVKHPKVEEEILDLVDVVDEAPEEVASAPAFDLFEESAADESESATDLDGDLDFAPMDLDIEENKEKDLFDSLGMKLEPELHGATDIDELDFNLSTQELSDAIDLLDAKLAEDPPAVTPPSPGTTTQVPTTISEEQLEKALENVIRRMFAEKIDLLLNEAIEKNVTAEIERLKEQLLKDSPED
ncbi:MAG: hypothetical protein JJV98_12015 [Desulfosarcina sp.]|nr:hypothetical protein [Desulfobacterales bacterium]